MPWSAEVLQFRRDVYRQAEPPPDLKLSQWAEENIILPEGRSARPGRYRNWPYMVEPLDAMSDPAIERITFIKSARIGYTKAICVFMGATAVNDPCPIILLMPTDEDARDAAVEEVEDLFQATPALKNSIRKGRNDGRNTLLRKRLLGGGSIKILSAVAPRKLRRHDCRVLLVDEADAMEVTQEGDAIAIAVKRTMAQPGRKIIIGSTPTEEGISVVEREYAQSDQSYYAVPCPHCGAFIELLWENLICRKQKDPRSVEYLCQECKGWISEREKPGMIERGQWIKGNPEVTNHRGFRLNAISSMLANATWPQLMAEWFEAVKGGPSVQMPFVNQVLGRPWKTSINVVDADVLRDRVEDFGFPAGDRIKVKIPWQILLITAGADVQDDRIEVTLLGWPQHGAPYVLGHVTFDGNTLEDEVWRQFDDWLKRGRWRNERGWFMRVDAVAVDSGGRDGRTQRVYNWCQPRRDRRIYAIKGREGPVKLWSKAQKVKGDMRLHIVGTDIAKTEVMDMLARDPIPGMLNGMPNAARSRDPMAIHLSNSLPDQWFDQVTVERRRLRFRQGRPVFVFELAREGLPNEALDCTVYAFAVRHAPSVKSIDLEERARREPDPEDGAVKQKASTGDWAARFAGM